MKYSDKYFNLLPAALKENSSEVVQPFLMGCGTKEPKITQLCLAAIQRLMSHEVVSEVSILTRLQRKCYQITHLYKKIVI